MGKYLGERERPGEKRKKSPAKSDLGKEGRQRSEEEEEI